MKSPTTAPAAQVAQSEREQFDSACKEYRHGAISESDLDYAWGHFQGYVWRAARADLASRAPASGALELQQLHASLTELVNAMRRYETDVEGDEPVEHRHMMERACAALAPVAASGTKQLADHALRPELGSPVLGAVAGQAKPFAYFVQPSSFGPFIECKPSQVGCFPAYRAAAGTPAIPPAPTTKEST